MKFYRYVAVTFASGDEYTSAFGVTKLQLREYSLLKETPKGYWIGYGYFGTKGKWIPKVSKKRYAYPTKKEALVNYIARTQKRVGYLKNNIDQCTDGIELARELLNLINE